MSNKTVRVIARVTSFPDKVEELKGLLLNLVEPTRREKGCLSYQLLQDKTNAAEFVFIEEWAGDSAENAHMTTAHVQDTLLKAQSLLAKAPDIGRYVIIG
ncbi:putative quinol monooxygenase [Methyloglobulus sp.]|uniref:putative quinol monooxygenase n=1 Tax=Methyloglobulus sp. TaxID=2518622 RepID=UPI003989ADB0